MWRNGKNIAWSIRGRHNKLLYENLNIHSYAAIEKALSLIDAYKDCGTLSRSRSGAAWAPPPVGYLKLSIDGAIFPNIHQSGIGFVLKDPTGQCLMATSIREPAALNP